MPPPHAPQHTHTPRSNEDIAGFMEFARSKNVHDAIFARIAPKIFGGRGSSVEYIKAAIACLLFGGARKVSERRSVARAVGREGACRQGCAIRWSKAKERNTCCLSLLHPCTSSAHSQPPKHAQRHPLCHGCTITRTHTHTQTIIRQPTWFCLPHMLPSHAAGSLTHCSCPYMLLAPSHTAHARRSCPTAPRAVVTSTCSCWAIPPPPRASSSSLRTRWGGGLINS